MASRSRAGFGAVLGVLFAVAVGAAALGFFVQNARTGIAGHLAKLIAGREVVTISAPDVVNRIQRLNRLETVTYSLDTVVESHESSPVLPDLLAGDRLLMIVHGQTVAGVDFSKLKPESVQIGEVAGHRSIRLTLPPSEVFFTRLDNGRSRVYTRETGIFVRADPNLESATRVRAEGDLQRAALEDGILDAASKNAQDTVRAMLGGLGFSDVQVQ